MPLFGSTPWKQSRRQAGDLLHFAQKIEAYRMDVIPPAQLEELRAAAKNLSAIGSSVNSKPDELDQAGEKLHAVMVKCGGNIYPVTFAAENAEMIMVAAILAIGIRAFFLQPFKIPTNSMAPTYLGMTPHVYAIDDPGPGVGEKAWNFVVQGASHYELRSPVGGDVRVLIDSRRGVDSVRAFYNLTPGRKWFGLLPEDKWAYTFVVGNQAIPFEVPADFQLDPVILQTYFPKMADGWKGQGMPYGPLERAGALKRDASTGQILLETGMQVQPGGRLLDFDVLTGDMLFVDRISYNFTTPKVGDPFVFSTHGIQGLNGGLDDKYFIKRLVGLAGDKLEVKPPGLYSKGQPIEGARSFSYEANETNGYPGYVNSYDPPNPYNLLPLDGSFVVPQGFFFAMGDNSPASYDSRWWGPVPAENVIGRALFVVYPFTHRVGPAH